MGCAASSESGEYDNKETNELGSYHRRVLLRALTTSGTSLQGSVNDIPSISWGEPEITTDNPNNRFQLPEASATQSHTFVRKRPVDSAAPLTTAVPPTPIPMYTSPAVGPHMDPSYLRSIADVPDLLILLPSKSDNESIDESNGTKSTQCVARLYYGMSTTVAALCSFQSPDHPIFNEQ